MLEIYQQRRNTLAEQLADNSVAFVFANEIVYASEDEEMGAILNRNFYYLTGLDAQGMVLAIAKLNGKITETIFILPYDELLSKWVGGRMSDEEVSAISGIKNVLNIDELDAYVSRLYNLMRSTNGLTVYLDLWKYEINQNDCRSFKFMKKLLNAYPNSKINDLYPILTDMRLIKDDYEVECIKHANKITNSGIKTMMRNIKPGMNEMVVEGLFDYALKQNLCNKTAFKTIAASGKRATILHYSDNNKFIADGELFLVDLGATYNYYCADVSRTFPVNGKFTQRQKEIYQCVLDAQKLVEANAKEGVTLKQLNDMVIEHYRNCLPTLGLNSDVSEYYFHGISHHLGLDTHDVDHRLLNQPLKKGMVITNEPGLYIEQEAIGIRIENDLLITEEGNINLSEDIIREIEDIEKFMKY